MIAPARSRTPAGSVRRTRRNTQRTRGAGHRERDLSPETGNPLRAAMTYEPVTIEHLLAHQGWALRVARQLVREEGEAEELVQRTWMAAMRRPPNSERGARSWIR